MKLKGIRVFGLLFVVLIAICGFSIRLMRYQITDGATYRKSASKATVESIPVVAPRGEILDRYGTVLATNIVGYSIILEYTTFTSSKTGNINDRILQITDVMTKCGQQWIDPLPVSGGAPYAFVTKASNDIDALKKRLVDHKLITDQEKGALTADKAISLLRTRYKIPKTYTDAQARTVVGVRYSMETSQFTLIAPYTFATNVSLDCINQMQERAIPGIEVTEQYTRTYPDGTLAPQVIGTYGKMNDKQYKEYKSKNYSMNDYIGQSGLEKSMESKLRGTNGLQNISINSTGTITGKEITVPPQPGNNIVTTLDANLQKILQQSLASQIAFIRQKASGDISKGANCKAGAAVVMNIKTAEVLGMATYPSYDNNKFYTDYQSILNTPGNPLNNRALMAYRPGSTFKPCVAVSALMNGVINKTEEINCNGSYMKYAPSYKGDDDGTYGPIAIGDAIAVSSNVFFDTLGDRLNNKSSTLLEQTAKAFGLGQPTGIELPENTGVISGPTETKARGETWYPANAVQSAIGQLDNLYSPLQLANYVGTLCNDGKRMESHIVKEIKSYDNTSTILAKTPKVVSDLKIPGDILETVKQGMLGVTQGDRTFGGTAAQVFGDYSLKIGGKTGTAEVPLYINGNKIKAWNGLFVAFAPYEDPQIAIAIVIENCEWGSDTAPIAKDVLNYLYMNNPDYSSTTLPASTSTLIH